MKKNLIPIISLLFVISCSWASVDQHGADKHSADKRQPAAIATAHPLATEAGEKILAQGGNAFDAAVAISAALAVVEPYSSGIGGGGFLLHYDAPSGDIVAYDGRETAPAAASPRMFLRQDGSPLPFFEAVVGVVVRFARYRWWIR